MSEDLLEFLNEIQKFVIKIKIQETLNTLIKDDRVYDVINADIVTEYYEKMYNHFEKNPQDFLFPNRKWLDESLERLGIDLSNVFDESENPDHIKREEIIILFLTLWINMKLQDPLHSLYFVKPYDLFYDWINYRVLILRPTKEVYLKDDDDNVLNHAYKKYGWYSSIHTFNIDKKGKVKYHYSSPDGITNIDKMYKKGHTYEMNDRCSLYPKTMIYKELADDILKEKERLKIIRPRNTKFVVREMTGISNKEYKQLLKDYKENRIKNSSDPYIKEIVDVLANDYCVEVNSDFISYAKILTKPKADSRFKSVAIIDIINAMIKLKNKIKDKEDE